MMECALKNVLHKTSLAAFVNVLTTVLACFLTSSSYKAWFMNSTQKTLLY